MAIDYDIDSPRTRKELLNFLWDNECWVDVFKAGNQYVIQYKTIISATHVPALHTLSFNGWLHLVQSDVWVSKRMRGEIT